MAHDCDGAARAHTGAKGANYNDIDVAVHRGGSPPERCPSGWRLLLAHALLGGVQQLFGREQAVVVGVDFVPAFDD